MVGKVIQSIRFNKKYYTVESSKRWIRKHGYKIVPFGKDNPQYLNYTSWRQRNPKTLHDYSIIKHHNMLFILGKPLKE